MEALTEVRVPCRHPDRSHDGHTVYLRPHLGLEGGLEAEAVINAVNALMPADPTRLSPTDPIFLRRTQEIVRRWMPIFVRHGAVGWDFPEPFDVEAIVADYALARPVADAASDLYTDEVLAPFQTAPDETSPTGPTGASTSVPPTPIPSRRRRSSRSTSAAGENSTE